MKFRLLLTEFCGSNQIRRQKGIFKDEMKCEYCDVIGDGKHALFLGQHTISFRGVVESHCTFLTGTYVEKASIHILNPYLFTGQKTSLFVIDDFMRKMRKDAKVARDVKRVQCRYHPFSTSRVTDFLFIPYLIFYVCILYLSVARLGSCTEGTSPRTLSANKRKNSSCEAKEASKRAFRDQNLPFWLRKSQKWALNYSHHL